MTEDLLKNLETELTAWERSASTRLQYPLVIKSYLAYTKPENIFTRQGVNDYLAKLTKEKKGGNTKRFVYYIIKKFFQVNDQKWPFPRGAPAKTPARELNAPAMPREDIERLITNRQSLETWEAGIIALSSTFGIRQEEVLRVGPQDMYDGKIFIHTVKHGVEREHLLPEIIAPYVKAWACLDDRHRPAKATLFVLFHSICGRCGVKTERGMGLHSIRRQLATELLRSGQLAVELVARGVATPEMMRSGLNLVAVYQFLRWSLPSAFGMLGVYSRLPDDLVDQAVLAAHPWLPLWSD